MLGSCNSHQPLAAASCLCNRQRECTAASPIMCCKLGCCRYHIVPGEALTTDLLSDGMILQSLIEGPTGELKVGGSLGRRAAAAEGLYLLAEGTPGRLCWHCQEELGRACFHVLQLLPVLPVGQEPQRQLVIARPRSGMACVHTISLSLCCRWSRSRARSIHTWKPPTASRCPSSRQTCPPAMPSCTS